MKFINLLFALIFLANISCQYQQKKDCDKFKNGSFSLRSELTGNNYLINRKDSLQIETEKETGKVTEWKVTWVNECEYNLLLINDNFGALKNGQFNEVPYFKYKIINLASTYYIFQTKFDLSKAFVTDTIWKVN